MHQNGTASTLCIYLKQLLLKKYTCIISSITIGLLCALLLYVQFYDVEILQQLKSVGQSWKQVEVVGPNQEQVENQVTQQVAEDTLPTSTGTTEEPKKASGSGAEKAQFSHANEEEKIQLIKGILAAQRHLIRGYRYVKGGKVAVDLRNGLQILDRLVQRSIASIQGTVSLLDLDQSNTSVIQANQMSLSEIPNTAGYHVTHNTSTANFPITGPWPFDVCGEHYTHSTFGYPYYFEGFVIDNCTGAPPFSDMLTVLINTVYNTAPEKVPQILNGLARDYPNLRVLVGCLNVTCQYLKTVLPDSKAWNIIEIPAGVSEAHIWAGLVANVQSKYVFVGRDIEFWAGFERLERLVRMLNFTAADIVGGGQRNSTGHWSHGCYQAVMRNYVLKLVQGYDLSTNSCIYCDYIGGPFAARTNFLQSLLQQNTKEALNGEPYFINLFSEVRNQSEDAVIMSCPDALFFTRSLSFASFQRSQWLPLVKKWVLSTVSLPTAEQHFNCSESSVDCSAYKSIAGVAMPKCCLRILSDMLKTLMRLCEKHGMDCDIEAGSNVGSVKFGENLPWERDADINWMANGYHTMLSLIPTFKEAGYALAFVESEGQPPITECMNNVTKNGVNCGYFALRDPSGSWRIEIWGVSYPSHEYFIKRNITVLTKVPYEGVYVNGHPNPAMYARNLYGDDAFAHVEHWGAIGLEHGWGPFKTGTFQKCALPGFHGCLENFLPTGSLQFLDIWI